MNIDRAIGTAVLVITPTYHWLWFLMVGRNIEGTSWNDIPTLPADAAQPAERLPSHFPENRPWRYTVAGDMLSVTPSVNIGNEWWHNGGQWSVKFVTLEGVTDRQAILRELVRVNDEGHTIKVRAALERWEKPGE